LIALGLFFVGVGLGVYKGMQVQDERQRRRHGGFRI